MTLTRSTRQGCPLSPLLFSMEPLGICLPSSVEYGGIFRGGTKHETSLFADDLLIYISDPSKSIPAVISILNKFGQTSGYKININKSIPFTIKTSPFDNSPFKISNQFKYLGINVTKCCQINIIKMTVLPKFLFLFQCIPIGIQNDFFSKHR